MIDGRRRGHIRQPVGQAIRKLFGNPDGRENKRRRWRLLQELTNEEVEELGLGEGALPERKRDEGDEREE